MLQLPLYLDPRVLTTHDLRIELYKRNALFHTHSHTLLAARLLHLFITEPLSHENVMTWHDMQPEKWSWIAFHAEQQISSSTILCDDILQHMHTFFSNQPLLWKKTAIGEYEEETWSLLEMQCARVVTARYMEEMVWEDAVCSLMTGEKRTEEQARDLLCRSKNLFYIKMQCIYK